MFLRKKIDFGHFFVQKFLVKFRQTFFRFAAQEFKGIPNGFASLLFEGARFSVFGAFRGGFGICSFRRFRSILENRRAKGIVLLYAGLWRNTFASKLGFALVASGWPPGRAFATISGPCSKFALPGTAKDRGLCGAGWAPGRALAKSLGPWARFIQSVLGALAFPWVSQGIRLGACRLGLGP